MDHVLALEQCSSTMLSSSSALGDTSPTLDCEAELAGLQGLVTEKESERDENGDLFSCVFETKISKLWVVFEDPF
ncbi:hypothetical protein SLE2022_327660 [Rubroshorea leprosula]